MAQNLSSAAVVIGALRVKICSLQGTRLGSTTIRNSDADVSNPTIHKIFAPYSNALENVTQCLG